MEVALRIVSSRPPAIQSNPPDTRLKGPTASSDCLSRSSFVTAISRVEPAGGLFKVEFAAMLAMEAVHWPAEMRRMVPEQPGSGELSPGVLATDPMQPPESHASVQVFTFVEGFSS